MMREIIGDYEAFFSLQNARLATRGIDITECEISHLALRTETYDEYLVVRGAIELQCSSNIENVWNGRPISIMQLKEPLVLGGGFEVKLIELIPPVHQRVYKMGMEHLGIVIGETVDEFSRTHRAVLTGQQYQSPECEPYYVTFFDDFTTVKFYRQALLKICESQHGRKFSGFSHVENWAENQSSDTKKTCPTPKGQPYENR
jgi:predicted metalloenzyme YecM